MPRFERSTTIPGVSAAAAFAWHARPGAFERLVPPWDDVRLVESSGTIEDGARKVLAIHKGPLVQRWVAVHEGYEAGRQFRDVQVEGPFRRWEHTHHFEDGPSGAVVTDRIDYELPLGALGATFGSGFAEWTIERMFRFRHARTCADLERHAAFADRPRITVAIGGASGLVGSALAPFLTAGGHRVRPFIRPQSGAAATADSIPYDPAAGLLDGAALAGVDAVVHLAGANVAGGSWTTERRREIRESRIRSTRLVAETLAQLSRPPRVLVCASAIGYYGFASDDPATEATPAGSGFLADVCREWEEATRPASEAGIRVVNLRIGVVLAHRDGALAKMLPAFLLGGGGPVGSGRQWMSCIALDDLVGAIHHALFDDGLAGPVNGTGPEPTTNAEFARTLGRVLGRPALLPVPEFAIRVLFGEMGETLLLGSTRVLPAALLARGFAFRHPTLEAALRAELGR